jgi:ribonuclease HI
MNLYSPSKSSTEPVQTIVTRRHPEAGCLIAWTDGACEPNPGAGGWGYRLEIDGAMFFEDYGGELETTNNRMELSAIVEAVAYHDTRPIIVRSDSQLCVLCAVGRWKRKTNLDLWRALDARCNRREVFFEWWRGHCGTPGNERADELAQIGRMVAMSAMT